MWITGIFAASINSRNSSLACCVPKPISITGFLALSINLAAFLILLNFGETGFGLVVSTARFVVSLIFWVNKSFGQMITETPFFSYAVPNNVLFVCPAIISWGTLSILASYIPFNKCTIPGPPILKATPILPVIFV